MQFFRFCHHHFADPCDCPRRWPWRVGRGQSAGGLWLQSLLIHVTMWAINIVIFVIVYGRMIEIYLLTSLAPIPVATLSNRELSNTGQNYLKSLFAVGFQGLLILVCVAIYAVLIQSIATSGDPIGAIWGVHGLFRAALLLPAQDWLHRPQRVQRTLKEVCVYRKIPHHLRRSARHYQRVERVPELF